MRVGSRLRMGIDSSQIVGVVLHFRTAARTLACLRSLVAEGSRTIVLVDNSEDGGASLSAMREELACLRAQGVRVEVLTPAQNLGFAKGVNTGLACAMDCGAKAILLINSDASFEQGSLANLLGGIEDAEISLPRVRSTRDSPTTGLFGFYQSATAILAHEMRLGCVQYPSGCCLLLRAEIAQPPFLDEDFFFYGEDVMLGRVAMSRGLHIVECPQAVVVHAGSGSAKNGSMFYEYHINRGHWLLARKLASNRFQAFVYVACRCLALPARTLVRSVRLRSLTPWRGLLVATFDVMKGRCRSFTPPAK